MGFEKAEQGGLIRPVSLQHKYLKAMLKTNRNEYYSSPETEVFKIQMEKGILAISGNDASLSGAGVDESDADDNGLIW